jgi:uncharacterized metal-binding protein
VPSGKTHDAITFLLAIPAFSVTYLVTKSVSAGAIVFVAFLLGGLMFGPDLDTVSRQYSRWFIFRPLWLPYRKFFKHRSRFSHGLVLGALLRVFYFAGVVTLVVFVAAYAYASYAGGKLPGFADISTVWRPIGSFVNANFGEDFYFLGFIGLWLGAASHTFTDMAGSFIKTGRVTKFL